MPVHTHPHIEHTPPPTTHTDEAIARWEDDGGPTHRPPPGPQTRQWLRIAAALTGRLPELAGREDVIVTCEHTTRSGAPAAFYPAQARLEINTALFAPLRPAAIDPTQPGDEDNYPTAWGAFTHEAAHAAHSRWTTPPTLRGTALDTAAQLLEESRAEHAHLNRRPGDRRYLRHAARTIILDGFTTRAPSDPWHAALAAGLILARRDAGILDPDETEPVHTIVTKILGPDTLATLSGIWTAAHRTADTDGPAMLHHAKAWCQALAINPQGHEPTPAPAAGQVGELAKAIGQSVGRVRANEAVLTAAQARAAAARMTRTDAKAAQAAQQRRAAQTAEKVFAPGGRPYTPGKTDPGRSHSPVSGTRPPTPAEKAAAGQLARALRTAAYRERTATVTASASPPGRLIMRQALARDAQRAAGVYPTATPWTRTTYRPTPTPPLRVGIAVDVSGSMSLAAGPIASAAWILAKATAMTDPDSSSATIAYDHSLTAITAPGRTPQRVTQFDAQGTGHRLAETIDALTAGLGLTQPGAARLLVIASDGYYTREESAHATGRITTLRATGCAVLWLAFDDESCPLPGSTLLELTTPTQAAAAIGKAATAALTAMHRP